MSTVTMIISVVPASLSTAYSTHAAQVLVAGFAGADRTKDGWGSPPGCSP